MQIPLRPPSATDTFRGLDREEVVRLLARTSKPDIDGAYLHWDQLRRHPPPEGLTSEQWWLQFELARKVLRTELPLVDATGSRFHFSRTEGLVRALHEIDRSLGYWAPGTNAELANQDLRDRVVVSSLMEEAITSSQLEGAATTRDVAKEMLRQNRAPRTKDERMILNNYRAMDWVRSHSDSPLSLPFLFELHRTLTDGTMEPEEIGRLRRSDENITVSDIVDGRILHVPPDAGALPKRLEALFAFGNETGGDAFMHPIVRAVALHFMIGYEHPFVDGNGRTARMLFYWSMLRQGLGMVEFLSISRVIQKAPSQYVRAYLYTETDSGDLTYFLMHQLDVIQQAKRALDEYMSNKLREVEALEPILRDEDFNGRQRALLAHALRHPAQRHTISTYQREHDVVYETARQDLLALEAGGYLTRVKIGRGFTFVAVKDLEKRLRRRRRTAAKRKR